MIPQQQSERTPSLMKNNKQAFEETISKRFYSFRSTHIHKSQNEAAKMLGVAQSILSYIESGKRAPSLQLIEILVSKFNLNPEWLTKGTGTPVEKNPSKKNLISDIGDLDSQIKMLRKQILVFEATQNHLIKRMERMEKEIEELKK